MRRALLTLSCSVLVLGGLAAAPTTAAAPPAPATPPPDSQFQKVVLDDSPGEPMDLAVLPDGRVLHVTRQGHVWLHDPDTGLKTLAAQLDVYQHDEEGLQNIALDPNFKQNGWIYLYYSPPLDTPVDDPATPTVNEGDAPVFGTPEEFAAFEGVIRLSRFQWNERTDTVDLGSEEQILDVPVDRGICCHVGGDIVFDGARQPVPLDRGRHEPVPVRRLHADRRARGPQPGVRRTADGGEHERPARQGPADHAEAGRRLHDPRRQPLRGQQPADTPGDLPDGPAEPVPDRVQPRRGRALRSRLLPGRPDRGSAARAGRPGQVVHRHRARQLRLAVLRDGRAAVPSTTTSPRACRARRSTVPTR